MERDLPSFRRHLGAHSGLHSISLTQQKLESGSDDSGCVPRIKLCSIPEIFSKQNTCWYKT